MTDIKNQIAFITEEDDHALAHAGIDSIDQTLRKAQMTFNQWAKLPEAQRTGESFIDNIDLDYFRLLDTLTIARSRKHIEKYYDINEIGHFPERKEPININNIVEMASNRYGDMVKAVADVRRELVAVDSDLHSDLETLLLEDGSAQEDLWGYNIYPELDGEDFIEFDSLINIRPRQNNFSRDVEDVQIQKAIIDITNKYILR